MYERRRLRQAQLYVLEVKEGWQAAQIVLQRKEQADDPEAEAWRTTVALFAREVVVASIAAQTEQRQEDYYLHQHGIPQRRHSEGLSPL